MVTIRFGFNGTQQRTTCSISRRPPAGCSTFAREDFRRVPLPAARMTIATSLFGIVRPFSPALLSLTIPGLDFCEVFPRRAGFRITPQGLNCAIDELTDSLYILGTRSSRTDQRTRRNGLEAMHKLRWKPG